MSQRLGIMGGMFDPVHKGHLAAALAAIDALGLEKLYLVPCSVPNHRAAASASAEHRLQMLKLAAGVDDRLQVDDRELRRQQISYTVDTLASFAEEFPQSTLVFVLGWDSYHSLPQWHRWQEIFNYCHLCAVSRPGSEMPDAAAAEAAERNVEIMAAELARRQAHSAEELFRSRSGGLFILQGVEQEAASSILRQEQCFGDTVQEHLPGPVAAYIREHQLYSH